jgi:hypothetical protein
LLHEQPRDQFDSMIKFKAVGVPVACFDIGWSQEPGAQAQGTLPIPLQRKIHRALCFPLNC